MEQEKSMNCTKAQASVMCKKDCPSSDNEESKLATESSCEQISTRNGYHRSALRLPWFALCMGLVCLNASLLNQWIWVGTISLGCMLLADSTFHFLSCLIRGKLSSSLLSLYYMAVIAVTDWYIYLSVDSIVNHYIEKL